MLTHWPHITSNFLDRCRSELRHRYILPNPFWLNRTTTATTTTTTRRPSARFLRVQLQYICRCSSAQRERVPAVCQYGVLVRTNNYFLFYFAYHVLACYCAVSRTRCSPSMTLRPNCLTRDRPVPPPADDDGLTLSCFNCDAESDSPSARGRGDTANNGARLWRHGLRLWGEGAGHLTRPQCHLPATVCLEFFWRLHDNAMTVSNLLSSFVHVAGWAQAPPSAPRNKLGHFRSMSSVATPTTSSFPSDAQGLPDSLAVQRPQVPYKAPSTSHLPRIQHPDGLFDEMSTIPDPRRSMDPMRPSTAQSSPSHHPDLNDEVATLSTKLIDRKSVV